MESRRPRGRPRGFALDAAIGTGQLLFHEKGYEQVGVAELTRAIGITPPSFYAAFGSKSAFFDETLRLYSTTVLPLDRLLVPGRPPRTALAELLTMSAAVYTAHPRRRGCFILEHARSGATEAGIAATRILGANRDRIRAFLDASDVPDPSRIADHVAATMLGLSAAAREGWDAARLSMVADIAVAGLDRLLDCGGEGDAQMPDRLGSYPHRPRSGPET